MIVEVLRFSVVQGEMVKKKKKKTVIKSKFSQLNKKRFYFPDRIVSLPFVHKSLKQMILGTKRAKK